MAIQETWFITNNYFESLSLSDITSPYILKSGETVDLLKIGKNTTSSLFNSVIIRNYSNKIITKGSNKGKFYVVSAYSHTHDGLDVLTGGENSDADNLHTHDKLTTNFEVNNLITDALNKIDSKDFVKKSGSINQLSDIFSNGEAIENAVILAHSEHIHNELSGLNEGDYLHLTSNQFAYFTTLTDGSNADSLHTHEIVSSHNSLEDIQGGITDQYYHLTLSQHDILTDGSNADGLHIHSSITDHNSLNGLQGGDPSNDGYYHLSADQVEEIHWHDNFDVLDLLGEDSTGDLTYNGVPLSGDGIYVPYTGALYDVDLGSKSLTTTGNIFINSYNSKLYFGEQQEGSIYYDDGTGDLIISVGEDPSSSNVIKLQDDVVITGLDASSGVYTDAGRQLTSIPPGSGTIGYWSRAGTVLSPANAGDDITTTGTGRFDGFVGVGRVPIVGIHVQGTTTASSSFTLQNTIANSFVQNQIQAGADGVVFWYQFGESYGSAAYPETTTYYLRGSSLIDSWGNGGLSLSSADSGEHSKIRFYTAGTNLRFTIDNVGDFNFQNGNLTTTGNISINSYDSRLYFGEQQEGSIYYDDGTGDLIISVGDDPSSSNVIKLQDDVVITGLDASSGVYTDAGRQLTSIPPTSGVLGYLDRTGTVLSPATTGDDITTTGTGTFGSGVLSIGQNFTGLDAIIGIDSAGAVDKSIFIGGIDTDGADVAYNLLNLYLYGKNVFLGDTATDDADLTVSGTQHIVAGASATRVLEVDQSTNSYNGTAANYNIYSDRSIITNSSGSAIGKSHGIYNYIKNGHPIIGSVGFAAQYTTGLYSELYTNTGHETSGGFMLEENYGGEFKVTRTGTSKSTSQTESNYGVSSAVTYSEGYNKAGGTIQIDNRGILGVVSCSDSLTAGTKIKNNYGVYGAAYDYSGVGTSTSYAFYNGGALGPISWGFYSASNNNFLGNDNYKTYWGSGKDASIYFDGSDLIINSENITAGDEVHFINFDAYLFDNKITFTQPDGNEYIDSLADGYMDYGATYSHRFSGGITKSLSTKTSDYNVLVSDYTILADATSNTVTITLPAAPNQGQMYNIKCINDTYTCTVARNGKNIDGDASDITLIEDEIITIQYDSTYGWAII